MLLTALSSFGRIINHDENVDEKMKRLILLATIQQTTGSDFLIEWQT